MPHGSTKSIESPRSNSPSPEKVSSELKTSKKRNSDSSSTDLFKEFEQRKTKEQKIDSPAGISENKQLGTLTAEKRPEARTQVTSELEELNIKSTNLENTHNIINQAFNVESPENTSEFNFNTEVASGQIKFNIDTSEKLEIAEPKNLTEGTSTELEGTKSATSNVKGKAKEVTPERKENKQESLVPVSPEAQTKNAAGDNKPAYDRSLYLQGEVTKAEYRLRDYDRLIGKLHEKLDPITLEVNTLVQWNSQDHINPPGTSQASEHSEAPDNAESIYKQQIDAAENTITILKDRLGELFQMKERINSEHEQIRKDIASIKIWEPDYFRLLRKDAEELAKPGENSDKKEKFVAEFDAQERTWQFYKQGETGSQEKVDEIPNEKEKFVAKFDAQEKMGQNYNQKKTELLERVKSQRETVDASIDTVWKELQDEELRGEVAGGESELQEFYTTLTTAETVLNGSAVDVDNLVRQNVWDEIIRGTHQAHLRDLHQVRLSIQAQVDNLNAVEIRPISYYDKFQAKIAQLADRPREDEFWDAFVDQSKWWQKYDLLRKDLLINAERQLANLNRPIAEIEGTLQQARASQTE